MNKIYVNFNEITLGELSYEHDLYKYEIYRENVAEAKRRGYPIVIFKIDKSFESYKLPESLLDFLPTKNQDIYELAKINDSDSTFQKLYKVASLPLSNQGISISI